MGFARAFLGCSRYSHSTQMHFHQPEDGPRRTAGRRVGNSGDRLPKWMLAVTGPSGGITRLACSAGLRESLS